MASRVLLIGAGASYGARINHLKQPPLGLKLCDWLRSIIPLLLAQIDLNELHSGIQAAASILSSDPNENNYEKLVSKLTRDQRLTLSRLLIIAFSDLSQKQRSQDLKQFDLGFRFERDGYDALIEKINIKNGDWSVVSLNYDLLLEESLDRAKIDFFYPHFRFLYGQDQSSLSGIRIYKPHGSINFFAHADPKIYHPPPPPHESRGIPTTHFTDEQGNFSPTHPIVMAAQRGVENVLHTADSARISRPVMANYTQGKAADVNQQTLALVRQEALKTIREAQEVVIIGVRPINDSADDDFVTKAFTALPKKLTFISGSQEECNFIKEAYPDAQTFSEGLQKFISTSQTSQL